MKALAPPEQAGTPAVRPARRGRYVKGFAFWTLRGNSNGIICEHDQD